MDEIYGIKINHILMIYKIKKIINLFHLYVYCDFIISVFIIDNFYWINRYLAA